MPYPVTATEATWAEVLTAAGGMSPWLCIDPLGNLYLFYVTSGNCYVRRKAARETTWSAAVQVTTGGGDSNPTAELVGSQKIVAAVDRTSVGIRTLTSKDAGATWTEVGTLAGEMPFLYRDPRMTYMVYYESGTIKVRRSQTDFSTVVDFTAGATATVMTGADDDRPAGRWIDHTGKHEVVVVVGGALKVYESGDAGETWSLKATL